MQMQPTGSGAYGPGDISFSRWYLSQHPPSPLPPHPRSEQHHLLANTGATASGRELTHRKLCIVARAPGNSAICYITSVTALSPPLICDRLYASVCVQLSVCAHIAQGLRLLLWSHPPSFVLSSFLLSLPSILLSFLPSFLQFFLPSTFVCLLVLWLLYIVSLWSATHQVD